VQLAEYLRSAIEHGRLADPLPATRRWSRELGVSRRVLIAAVKELAAEGWLTVHRRGARLKSRARGIAAGGGVRRVRLLYSSTYRGPGLEYSETVGRLKEQLALRGIELAWENCSASRLREMARQAGSRELLVLASLSPVYQRLFAETGKPVCVLGEVAPGLDLPFINVEQSATMKHAAFALLRHGVRELVAVHIDADSAGLRTALGAFRAACAEWPRQPVSCRLISTPLDPTALPATARRLLPAGDGKVGYVVLAPIPVGFVMTALMHQGVTIPARAEVVALFHSADAVKLHPPPLSYPFPSQRIARQLTDLAARFFDTGAVPEIRKTLWPEVAAARRADV
jgi:DNA-binding LacI/PurR family transcriptional regulator